MINRFSFEEYEQIQNLYRESIEIHPSLYTKNQLNLFYHFITVETPYAWENVSTLNISPTNDRPTFNEIKKRGSYPDCIKCSNTANAYYARSLLDFGFQFKPYFWILLGIAVIVYSIKNKRLLSLVLSASGILYIFSYIPFIPAYDYRYSYASVLLIYVSILYLMIDKFKRGENSEPKT